MTADEVIGWFKAAPMGSRHQRMIWAARKIAHLTGVTEGRAYQMLLIALIEAEGSDEAECPQHGKGLAGAGPSAPSR